MNNNVRFCQLIIAALCIGSTLSCGGAERRKTDATPLNTIEGVWQRKDPSGRKINISFGKDNKFILHLHSIKMQFPGEFTVSDNTIRIVDKYCGTALPGLFRFNVKKDTLRFETLDDAMCERRKILSDDIWIPDTVNPVTDSATVYDATSVQGTKSQ